MLINNLYSRGFSSEFTFKTSRSGGAGGQNVNKVNTKVELRFTIANSELLTDEEKIILTEKLSNRITNEGYLVIVSQVERTQLGNKQRCVEKFFQLVSKALTPRKKRTPTKPTRASKAKRMESKRITAIKKESRKKPLM